MTNASRHRRRPAQSIRVLIADDHPVVRQGLRQIFAAASEIVLVGEASTAGEVLTLIRSGTGDVLVLDLAMPGTHGTDLVEAVHRERPDLPVLVLSMYPVEHFAVRALRAGAAGYLTKDTAGDELLRAVRTVHGGQRYLTADVANVLAAELAPASERPLHAQLSNREYQVLRLFGTAATVREIARRLHLSEKTVSTYRARLLEKMQARNTAELIRYAVQHRLDD